MGCRGTRLSREPRSSSHQPASPPVYLGTYWGVSRPVDRQNLSNVSLVCPVPPPGRTCPAETPFPGGNASTDSFWCGGTGALFWTPPKWLNSSSYANGELIYSSEKAHLQSMHLQSHSFPFKRTNNVLSACIWICILRWLASPSAHIP